MQSKSFSKIAQEAKCQLYQPVTNDNQSMLTLMTTHQQLILPKLAINSSFAIDGNTSTTTTISTSLIAIFKCFLMHYSPPLSITLLLTFAFSFCQSFHSLLISHSIPLCHQGQRPKHKIVSSFSSVPKKLSSALSSPKRKPQSFV